MSVDGTPFGGRVKQHAAATLQRGTRRTMSSSPVQASAASRPRSRRRDSKVHVALLESSQWSRQATSQRHALGRVGHGAHGNRRQREIYRICARRSAAGYRANASLSAYGKSQIISIRFAQPNYPFAVDPSVTHAVLKARIAALAARLACIWARRSRASTSSRLGQRHHHRSGDTYTARSISTRPIWATCCRSPASLDDRAEAQSIPTKPARRPARIRSGSNP